MGVPELVSELGPLEAKYKGAFDGLYCCYCCYGSLLCQENDHDLFVDD